MSRSHAAAYSDSATHSLPSYRLGVSHTQSPPEKGEVYGYSSRPRLLNQSSEPYMFNRSIRGEGHDPRDSAADSNSKVSWIPLKQEFSRSNGGLDRKDPSLPPPDYQNMSVLMPRANMAEFRTNQQVPLVDY